MGRPPGEPTAELVAEVARIAGRRGRRADLPRRATPTGRPATELEAVARREAEDLAATAEACARAGVEIREISVGATPTAAWVSGPRG